MPFDRQRLDRHSRAIKDMDLSIEEVAKLDRMDDSLDEAAMTNGIGQDAFARELEAFCKGDWTDLECKCWHVFIRTCFAQACK